MCGSKPSPPPPPAVIVDNPAADAARNANIATRRANQQNAAVKRRAAMTSLFTMGQAGITPTQQAAAPTLFNSAYGVNGGGGG